MRIIGILVLLAALVVVNSSIEMAWDQGKLDALLPLGLSAFFLCMALAFTIASDIRRHQRHVAQQQMRQQIEYTYTLSVNTQEADDALRVLTERMTSCQALGVPPEPGQES